jgi:hypothetical protein
MTVKIVVRTARVQCKHCKCLLEYTDEDIHVAQPSIFDERNNDLYYIICPFETCGYQVFVPSGEIE